MSSLKLWPKQEEAYRFAIERDEVALFCEQRTGKTYLTLAILRKLAGAAIDLTTGKGNDFCGLLICLLNNRDSTWIKGLSTFLPWLSITTDWEEFKRLPNPRLFIVHFEGLPKVIDRLARYKKFNWCAIDEAHRLAHRGTGQSRAASRLSWIPRKLILTGTPIEQQPTDIFAQFRFLAPRVLGTNWAEFESAWLTWPHKEITARPGTMAWQSQVLQQRILKNKAQFRWELLDEYHELIAPYSFRLTKESVGISPPKIIIHSVGMSRRQARAYQDIRRHGLHYLGPETSVSAPLKVTRRMKRRQIASGFVLDDDGTCQWLGRKKLDRVLKLVETLPKPVVVFTAFRDPAGRLKEELDAQGYEAALVTGKTPKRDRPIIWRDFQAAKYDVLVVQSRVGGVGVDLWRAGAAIVHSLTESYIDWDQLISRLDSRDRKNPASIHLVLTNGTVDEEQRKLLSKKGETARRTLNPIVKRRSGR